MELSPLLAELGRYPFTRLDDWRAEAGRRGLDAVNLGPGATRYAHAADERVEIAELQRTYDALRRFLAGTV